MTLSKEEIAAYADGELEGEALHKAEAAIAADPALQTQVNAHRTLKARLSAYFAPIVEMQVPERLVSTVKGEAHVVDFAKAAANTRAQSLTRIPPRLRWAGPALAASLVVALVGYGISQRPVHDYATGEVAVALDRQLVATQPAQAPVRILLSFRDADGHFCRGFSSQLQSGIACRDGRGWKLSNMSSGERSPTGEYRTAGSAEAEILAAIQDMANGPALNAREEEIARSGGWRR